MLVEDSPDDAFLLQRQLRRGGYDPSMYRVVDAPTLTTALAEGEWDVIIADFIVPGLEILDVLRMVQQSGRDVPFIVVSGRVGEDEAAAILKAGAHDFVTKERLARLVPAIERERREAAERAARRTAEQSLRESEERLQLALETAELGSWDWDVLDDRLTETRLMRELLGRPPDQQADGMASVLRSIHEEDRAPLERAIRQTLKGDGPLRAEFRVTGPSTEVRWLEAQARVMRDEAGRPCRMIGVTRDITARKAVEAEREILARGEKLRALGQMASGIAHDLNQALAIVTGYADLTRAAIDVGDLASACEHVETISRASLQGAETVKQLLAFAQHREQEPSEPVEISALLDDVARFTAPKWADLAQAEGGPIRLEVETEPNIWVRGWGHALREALVNLVLNAVDALPTGGSIRLAARRRGDRVLIEVADTGIGMPPEVLQRIFEPFFTTKGERGTGLGLAMVFGIVERHGGEITVESKVGLGTTFCLTLPCGNGTVVPEAVPVRPPTTAHLRILAVDDDPDLALMLQGMLSRDDHDVRTTESAEMAVNMLEQDAYDLVISDLSLGEGMNGWDLAAIVRQRWPRTRFALVSGWGPSILEDEARARNVDVVLAKPYRRGELRALVGQAIAAPRSNGQDVALAATARSDGRVD